MLGTERNDTDIAERLAGILEAMARKLRKNPQRWMEIMLRLHLRVGRVIEELVEEGWE